MIPQKPQIQLPARNGNGNMRPTRTPNEGQDDNVDSVVDNTEEPTVDVNIDTTADPDATVTVDMNVNANTNPGEIENVVKEAIATSANIPYAIYHQHYIARQKTETQDYFRRIISPILEASFEDLERNLIDKLTDFALKRGSGNKYVAGPSMTMINMPEYLLPRSQKKEPPTSAASTMVQVSWKKDPVPAPETKKYDKELPLDHEKGKLSYRKRRKVNEEDSTSTATANHGPKHSSPGGTRKPVGSGPSGTPPAGVNELNVSVKPGTKLKGKMGRPAKKDKHEGAMGANVKQSPVTIGGKKPTSPKKQRGRPKKVRFIGVPDLSGSLELINAAGNSGASSTIAEEAGKAAEFQLKTILLQTPPHSDTSTSVSSIVTPTGTGSFRRLTPGVRSAFGRGMRRKLLRTKTLGDLDKVVTVASAPGKRMAGSKRMNPAVVPISAPPAPAPPAKRARREVKQNTAFEYPPTKKKQTIRQKGAPLEEKTNANAQNVVPPAEAGAENQNQQEEDRTTEGASSAAAVGEAEAVESGAAVEKGGTQSRSTRKKDQGGGRRPMKP